jgi:hypothetical protein
MRLFLVWFDVSGVSMRVNRQRAFIVIELLADGIVAIALSADI